MTERMSVFSSILLPCGLEKGQGPASFPWMGVKGEVGVLGSCRDNLGVK